MQYQNIFKAVFLRRLNRFVAEISIDNNVNFCHVKNTGRCAELLREGAEIYVEACNNPARKTPYTLIAVRKNGILFNIDSYAPNIAAKEWVCTGGLGFIPDMVRSEVCYGNSRFDLCYEYQGKTGYIEVKGVTLEENGIALFPDAPTERGIKHIEELCKAQEEGHEAAILFVAQFSPVKAFSPNRRTHPSFADALVKAKSSNVSILCMACTVTADTMTIGYNVPVIL